MNPSQGAIDRDFNRETMQKILLFVQKRKRKRGSAQNRNYPYNQSPSLGSRDTSTTSKKGKKGKKMLACQNVYRSPL